MKRIDLLLAYPQTYPIAPKWATFEREVIHTRRTKEPRIFVSYVIFGLLA